MASYPPVAPVTGREFTSQTHTDTYPAIDPVTQSDCTGRAVLITGASRGVGLATAISYALAGASHIALTARSDLQPALAAIEARCTAAQKPVPQLLAIRMDVASEESVAAGAARVRGAFGRLDILYNNAGYMPPWQPVAESDAAEWWRTWETNVRGVYLVSRALVPLLLETAGGLRTLVNTSSIAALTTLPGGSAYQGGKTAVLRIADHLMAEYGGQGLLAYSIHPGAIRTDITTSMPKALTDTFRDTVELPADALVFLTHVRRPWLAGRYVALPWDMPEFLSREKEIVDGDKLRMKLVV